MRRRPPQRLSLLSVNDKYGRGKGRRAFTGWGSYPDRQPASEAQETGCCAFNNFPNIGPKGVAHALENAQDFIESRQRSSIQAAGILQLADLADPPPRGCFDSPVLAAKAGTAAIGRQLDLVQFSSSSVATSLYKAVKLVVSTVGISAIQLGDFLEGTA